MIHIFTKGQQILAEEIKMEIIPTQCKRAGTRIIYYYAGEEIVRIEDSCFIFPDEANGGDYCVAVSHDTSKVGWGETIEDAYVDLIVGTALALKYTRENHIRADIGVKSKHQFWEDKKIKQVSRIDKDLQLVLLNKAKSIIEGKEPEIIDSVIKKGTHLGRKELDKTLFDFQIVEDIEDKKVG